ncbi:MAG: hypothetical protein GXO90_08365, partial [FCB group bacterium]|nr:hypothetical protein [FCB group bacterium]
MALNIQDFPHEKLCSHHPICRPEYTSGLALWPSTGCRHFPGCGTTGNRHGRGGDAPELGAWDPAQAPILSPVNDTLFTGTVLIDRPRVIEYKITRESWSQEALTETRQVPPNSVARLKRGLNEIRVRVPAWKDAVTVAPSSSPQSITGDVRLHPEFYSPQLNNLRTIR